MCDHRVIDTVKDRLLTRRALFRLGAGATATAAASAGTGLAPAEAAEDRTGTGRQKVIDLTHTLSPEFPTFSGQPGISYRQVARFRDSGVNLFDLTISEHTGTHVDAPLHFSEDGKSVDEIPVTDLVTPLVVINISKKAETDPDAQVTPDDLRAWIARNGALPEKCCVAMNSGWARFASNNANFTGRKDGVMHFPGFHVETARMLMEESSAVALAVDTLSLDHGRSKDFATHYTWLPSGRYGVENVAHLDSLPEKGATLVVGAPKTKGGTGGPARVMALL